MKNPVNIIAVISLLLKKTGVTFTYTTLKEKLLSHLDYLSLTVNDALQELSVATEVLNYRPSDLRANNFISFYFIGKRL